jgi:hypothetical protein
MRVHKCTSHLCRSFASKTELGKWAEVIFFLLSIRKNALQFIAITSEVMRFLPQEFSFLWSSIRDAN